MLHFSVFGLEVTNSLVELVDLSDKVRNSETDNDPGDGEQTTGPPDRLPVSQLFSYRTLFSYRILRVHLLFLGGIPSVR